MTVRHFCDFPPSPQVWPNGGTQMATATQQGTQPNKVKVAIIGSGNIGIDLMMKVLRTSDVLEMGALVGIDPASDGLARAARLGVATTHEGIEGLRKLPVWRDIGIVFDATSAAAHKKNSEAANEAGKVMIDLT